MTAHKHAKLIKAKADNMELVLFIKVGDQWQVTGCHDNQIINIASHYEYFLCLPKHKESCLHWLNGGNIQYKTDLVEEFQDYQPKIEFGLGSIFMLSDFEIRIKPRKEKRWIAHFKSGDDFCTTQFSYKTIEQLKGATYAPNGFDNWQFIEIEVEV